MLLAILQNVTPLRGHLADHGRARVVRHLGQTELFIIYTQQLRDELRRRCPHHPFLRLADGDDFGRHALDRNVDPAQLDPRAVAAVCRHLRRTSHDSARAEIFERGRDPALAQERKDAVAGAHQNVFEERIGNLHGAFVELGVTRIQR